MTNNRQICNQINHQLKELNDMTNQLDDFDIKSTIYSIKNLTHNICTDFDDQIITSLENYYGYGKKKHIMLEKVIFLDIDGVLNNEENTRESYVDEDMVRCLKRIVDETGAVIVLTSSWRGAFYHYFNELERYRLDNTEISEDEKIKLRSLVKNEKALQILDTLNKYNLMFYDRTDDLYSGHLARPAEIRKWLIDKPTIKSFVILDDDYFWQWNYLTDKLVLTCREIPSPKGRIYVKYKKGLDNDFTDQAIKILNEYRSIDYINDEDLRWEIEYQLKHRCNETLEEIAEMVANKFKADSMYAMKKIREVLDEDKDDDEGNTTIEDVNIDR